MKSNPHPIAKPNKTKCYSARPQTIQREKFINQDFQTKANLSRPTSIDRIDSFLQKELSQTHSVSDKMFVYQRSFDLLIREFQVCRPLLERIKKQYDEICSDLISRKLEITTNTTSISYAEDAFSESINELRRTKTKEFAQKKIESEKLLDNMTDLRLKRSELLEHLDILTKKELDLAESEKTASSQIIEFTSKRHDTNEEAKEFENLCKDQIDSIKTLKDDIEHTYKSTKEIKKYNESILDELSCLEKDEKELNEKIEKLSIDNITKTKETQEIIRNNEMLASKINKKQNDLNQMQNAQNELEIKLKALLENAGIDSTLPIEEILEKLQNEFC